MSAIETYTNIIRSLGLELDTSDKEYIQAILINIMSGLDISIVPTDLLTMLDEKRRVEVLPKLSEVICFGEESNGQIIDTNGDTICNLHEEAINPDVFIPLSASLIKEGTELRGYEHRQEIDYLIEVIERISKGIDKEALLLANLEAKKILLEKRSSNIDIAISNSSLKISKLMASIEQLKILKQGTERDKELISQKIDSIKSNSVKGKK